MLFCRGREGRLSGKFPIFAVQKTLKDMIQLLKKTKDVILFYRVLPLPAFPQGLRGAFSLRFQFDNKRDRREMRILCLRPHRHRAAAAAPERRAAGDDGDERRPGDGTLRNPEIARAIALPPGQLFQAEANRAGRDGHGTIDALPDGIFRSCTVYIPGRRPREGGVGALVPRKDGQAARPGRAFLFFNAPERATELYGMFEKCVGHIQPDTVLVVEGLRASRAMRDFWERVKAHPATVLTFDLYHVGLVFFNKKMYRKDYIVYF